MRKRFDEIDLEDYYPFNPSGPSAMSIVLDEIASLYEESTGRAAGKIRHPIKHRRPGRTHPDKSKVHAAYLQWKANPKITKSAFVTRMRATTTSLAPAEDGRAMPALQGLTSKLGCRRGRVEWRRKRTRVVTRVRAGRAISSFFHECPTAHESGFLTEAEWAEEPWAHPFGITTHVDKAIS